MIWTTCDLPAKAMVFCKINELHALHASVNMPLPSCATVLESSHDFSAAAMSRAQLTNSDQLAFLQPPQD